MTTIPTMRKRVSASPVASVQQDTAAARDTRDAFAARERQFQVALFAVAIVLYLPGIGWGLPHATAPDRIFGWGSDELGPLQPLSELYSTFIAADPRFNPQYPLFHYFVQALFCGPYLAFQWLAGGFSRPSPVYPFGFQNPVDSLATLMVLSRLPSLLMGAAVPVLAYRTARVLWDRAAAIGAAATVLPMYALFYYSRTSNVDVPALFWIALGLLLIAVSMHDGLTLRRALAIASVAAFATATKDASAFAFIPAGAVLAIVHLRREKGSAWSRVRLLLAALVSTAVLYILASGLVFNTARFAQHLEWIRGSTAALVYPATLAGYFGLARESLMHTNASIGLPAMVLAVAGIILCAARARPALWLLIPALTIFAATIVPIHFVNFRYVLVIAYISALYAGYALGRMYRADRRAAIPLAAIVIGWSLVRGADLTYQMLNDSRYTVGRWLDENVRQGERVAYFAASQKLPPLGASIDLLQADGLCTAGDWLRSRPEFVLMIPQQHFELTHEWTVRDALYGALEDGSLGYESLGRVQAARLSEIRSVPFVNPPVELFVRRDRGVRHTVLSQRRQPAVLRPLQAAIGLLPRVPPGLVVNNDERTRRPCEVSSRLGTEPEVN